MFFRTNKKKKEENKETKKHFSIGDMYLECASYYINYKGKLRGIENPVDNKDFYEEMAGYFYYAVMHFVNYLESNYNDEVLNNDAVIEIDLNGMIDGASKTTLELFYPPTFPNLIYINESYSTHFHTDGKIIYDTENIQVLPGLSSLLASEKINKLFNGLTPIEARELLKQMSIYPNDKKQELEQVINDYKERQNIQEAFYKSIICLLLIRRSKYGIKRARLFADSLGVYFDFSPFEKEDEHLKIKTL